MSDFHLFKTAVNAQYESMLEGELFTSNVSKDGIFETYINAFKDGTDPMYKEATEHTCNCCKQFLRAGGDVLALINGEIVSIWDVQLEEGSIYQPVADALSAYVKAGGLKDVFRHYSKDVGTDYNHQLTEDGTTLKWEHFHYKLPSKFVMDEDSIASYQGTTRSNKEVLTRGLIEITQDALDIVIDLIEQGSLYKGDEFLNIVTEFRNLKLTYDTMNGNKEGFVWNASLRLGNASRFRNSSIGTLLVDISEGTDLEVAVKKFENKVAPHNYKRSVSLHTPKQKEAAFKRVVELGLEDSLHRRPATIDDITINNVRFADRTAKKSMGVFDMLDSAPKAKVPELDKIEEVSIETFMNSIVPKAESISVLVENSHVRNMMTLVAPVYKDSKNLFKWNNNFSWAYNGDITDSMTQRVIEAGGRVDGVLRFTHEWNHTGKNQSLMDLHVFLPGHGTHNDGKHDNYGNTRRVGWNNRRDHITGGIQDVDHTVAPGNSVPVENITFPDMDKLPEGKYTFKIHNWKKRTPCTTGFKAQIALNGEVYNYELERGMENKEWVTVATAILKNGVFTINHVLKPTCSSQDVWDISTQTFQKVSVIMDSPNFWDDQKIGNKHIFFMLENLKNPNPVRGFFNEFLRNELHDDRKVFEVLGSKLKTEVPENQLSGLGFSSTQRNHLICQVRGSFNRTVKVNF